MNFEKQQNIQKPADQVLGCNGTNNGCGYGTTFDKALNTQMHGMIQKRNPNPSSCPSTS